MASSVFLDLGDQGGPFSGQMLGPAADNTAAPPYSFVGDPDTGYASSAADTLALVAGGQVIATVSNPTGASQTSNYLNLTRTVPNTSQQFNGVFLDLTEPAAGVTNATRGLRISVTPSATAGTAPLIGIAVGIDSNTADESAGIGAGASNLTNPGTGKRYGGTFTADRGDWNIGSISSAYDSPATYQIGAAGLSEGLGTNSIGGLFQVGVDGHLAWTPPAVSAALVANNNAAALPIFLALDNGSAVFTIADGGGVTSTGPYLGPGGSAAAPAFAPSTDSDTGWYSAGSGLMALSSNNSFVLRLSSNIDFSSTGVINFSGTSSPSGSPDVVLSRGAANRLLLAVGDAFNHAPTAFASLPTGAEGDVACVTDSNTATWGATIAGGGANNVLAFFNGTNWTVAAA